MAVGIGTRRALRRGAVVLAAWIAKAGDERWVLSASPASVEAVGVDFVMEVASAVDSGDDMDTSIFNDDSAQQTAA